MNILILGSGGREHALAWKLGQSKKASKIYVAPGNAGTGLDCINVPLALHDFEAIKRFVLEEDVKLVVVGPEDPLANGITDFFKNDPFLKNVRIFGPGKIGAQLESSKDFAKEFMIRHQIPTAAYQSFTSATSQEAFAFIDSMKPPYVLKADGLAAGKGVLIPENAEDAKYSLSEMFSGKFGAAGNTVVIEEFLHGIELSVFAITDGKDYLLLPEAKDYKRIGEGDTGLNTGGMGSISPVPFADEAFMKKVEDRVVRPTIKGLEKDGIPYVGFVFFGLMNVNGDPFVIEYNVRMGDPETESVIPRIESDLLDAILAACDGRLSQANVQISGKTAASIMLVSGGYPEAYEKNKLITGLPEASQQLVFHAGTLYDDGKIYTNGGRVLALTSLAETLEEALALSYQLAESLDFEGKYYRRDLGKDLM